MENIAGGIFILIVGIVIIILGKSSGYFKVLGIAGAVMAVLGILVIWDEILGLNDIGRLLMVWLIGGSLGGLCLYFGWQHLYIKLFCCRRKVMGTFLEVKRAYQPMHRNRRSYVPVFQYCIDGRQYRKESEERYLRKGRLEKYYKSGQEYPIFVSVKNPRVFVLKRRPFLADIIQQLTGLMFLGTAVFMTVRILK